jgi:hypothetical protein
VDPLGLDGAESVALLSAEYYGLCVLVCLGDNGNVIERLADEAAAGGYEAAAAAQTGNIIGNGLAGDTGRVGVGGTPPHPTSWAHKLGSKFGPGASRVGRFVGRFGVVTTLVDGAWNLGTAVGCLAKCGSDLSCILAEK